MAKVSYQKLELPKSISLICFQLLTITLAEAPVAWTNEKDVESIFRGLPVGRTHNVVINEELEYGVAVGAAPRTDKCGAGLIFFDLKDPKNPLPLGCDASDGYVHDVSCFCCQAT